MKWSFLKPLVLLTQLGLSMAIPIVLTVFIGRRLDLWLGTGSVFTVIFVILGVLASFRNLFVMIRKVKDD